MAEARVAPFKGSAVNCAVLRYMCLLYGQQVCIEKAPRKKPGAVLLPGPPRPFPPKGEMRWAQSAHRLPGGKRRGGPGKLRPKGSCAGRAGRSVSAAGHYHKRSAAFARARVKSPGLALARRCGGNCREHIPGAREKREPRMYLRRTIITAVVGIAHEYATRMQRDVANVTLAASRWCGGAGQPCRPGG